MEWMSEDTKRALQAYETKLNELRRSAINDFAPILFAEVRKYAPSVSTIHLVRRNEYNDEGYDDELSVEVVDENGVDIDLWSIDTNVKLRSRWSEYEASAGDLIREFLDQESLLAFKGLLVFDGEIRINESRVIE